MPQSVDTVYIISSVDFGKVQRHTERYYLAKYCSENYNTHIISPSSTFPNVSNHNFYSDGILGVLLLNIVFLPKWLQLFVQDEPDVVHCYPDVFFPPILAQLVTDAEVIFDVRADPFEQPEEFSSRLGQEFSVFKQSLFSINRYLFQWAVNRADLVVSLSDDLEKKLCENYDIDQDLMHIMPQGVDTAKFEPGPSKHKSDLNITYIGTMNGLRGLDTFFDGVGQLDPQAQSRVRIELIGGGNQQFIDDLLATATESMPELTIDYHGYVEHDSVPNIASKNNFAVSPLPGLESYNVSSPAKVYEYIGLGLPVIATDIPAHQTILTDNEDSVIVSPESPEQIADAIEMLLDEPDRVTEMGEKARKNALKHSWESRFSELFEEIKKRSANQ